MMEKSFKKQTTIAICLGIYAFVTLTVCLNAAVGFDDGIRFPVYTLRDTTAAEMLTGVSTVLHYLVSWKIIVPACILLLIISKTRIVYGIPVSTAALAVTVFNKFVKSMVQRPRPDDIAHLASEGGWSFSSGHSITSMCLCALVIWIVIRRCRKGIMKKTAAQWLTIFFSLILILTGPSRIYLGVHYPSDVLAGWAAGLAAAMAVVLVIQRFKPWRLEGNVSGTSVKENAL